jgi:WD40 repeat protein
MTHVASDFDSRDVNIEFHLKDVKIEENFDDRKIYAVTFCDFIPSMYHYFASAGSNAVSVYRITTFHKLELVQHFMDTDISEPFADTTFDEETTDKERTESENFYTCSWSLGPHNHPLVVAGGKRGIVKVLNTITMEATGLVGHGGLINELRTHTNDPGFVFSASKDRSIRMWNMRTMVCVAVFGGDRGHRDEVLSLDIHLLGNCLASASMDTSIKIWNLNDPKLLDAMEKSDDHHIVTSPERSFAVVFLQFPLYSTTQIHTDYVDCVRWVGDCLLTKSTNNRVVLWAPDAQRHKVRILLLSLLASSAYISFWIILRLRLLFYKNMLVNIVPYGLLSLKFVFPWVSLHWVILKDGYVVIST